MYILTALWNQRGDFIIFFCCQHFWFMSTEIRDYIFSTVRNNVCYFIFSLPVLISCEIIILVFLGNNLILTHVYLASLSIWHVALPPEIVWILWRSWKKNYCTLQLPLPDERIALIFKSKLQSDFYWFLKWYLGFKH